MIDRNKIIYLIERYTAGETTQVEEKELFEIMQDLEHNDSLRKEVTRIFEETAPVNLDTKVRERMLKNIFSGKENLVVSIERNNESRSVVRRKFSWRWAGAAAVILITFSAVTYYLVSKSNSNDIAKSATPKVIQNDVSPGGNKAVLTLSDNSTIVLDNAANGTLSQQGNAKILKLTDGQLAYNALNEKPTELLYNTVTTPRGGIYNLTLADGSKVWLNASSSIRFPASFTGTERNVELTGEAYFEVAKNAAMPFRVKIANKGTVEVLGTHFNINAYADEASINTTLLEGKVKVSAMSNQQFLSPGQQAQLNGNGQIKLEKNADLEQVMAWKNGNFNFTNANLQTVMRQLSRWYDIDIIYDGTIPQREFAGEMHRDLNLSQVLRILEKNDVHFKVEGKKLFIKNQ